MVGDDLLARRLSSGWDYLAALRRLGAEPEGLCWAQVSTEPAPGGLIDEWRLILISSLIDEAGPLALSRVLFQAYNLAATPPEISPFIVEVVSPKTPLAARIVEGLTMGRPESFITTEDGEILTVENGGLVDKGFWFQVADLLLSPAWVYKIPSHSSSWKERRQQWLRFRQNVQRMAA